MSEPDQQNGERADKYLAQQEFSHGSLVEKTIPFTIVDKYDKLGRQSLGTRLR